MQFAKRVSIITLLLFFLAGNIGLGIFTHTCETLGTQKSIFVKGEDPCETEHAEEVAKSCCHETCEAEPETKLGHDDCCSTDVEYVHLNVDQRQVENHAQAVYASSVINIPSFSWEPIVLAVNKGINHQIETPPPSYQGRKIHKLNQIFVI